MNPDDFMEDPLPRKVLAHFAKEMLSRRTLCGKKVVWLHNAEYEHVYHKRHETVQSVEARSEVPCARCVAFEPLADLADCL
jgi:hypothetical protein